jgi:imidazolonepropionase-like amidohydrolase
MKTKLVVLLIGLLGLALTPASVAQAQRVAPPETLIRNATVLTITRGTLENTDVLLRNGKIAAVGKNLNASANARIIDGTGKYVMPGIIDAHSHSMLDTINEGTLAVTSMVRTEFQLRAKDPGSSVATVAPGNRRLDLYRIASCAGG